MKKLFFLFACCFLTIGAFAQNLQTNITDTSCFCCNGFYALPTPVINGPTTVDCGQKPVYFIKACPGATITWSVSAPNTIASGQGTSTITLAPVTGTNYSVAVQIKCGNKVVESKIPVRVNAIQNCTAAFSIILTQLPNGNFKIDANPNTTSGTLHYWGLVGNGTGNTCTPIPLNDIINGATFGESVSPTGVSTPIGMGTGINAGTTGYGYQYSGLGNSGCYKLTHYINCCGIWYRQTQCFCVSFSNARSANPEITKSEVEQVSPKDLPKELKNDWPQK